MRNQVHFTPAQRAAMLDKNPRRSGTQEVAPDLAYKRLAIVNIVMFGQTGAADRQWVLIDAGVAGTAGLIARAATARFGRESRPAAIILTHGHFDHVGSVEKLADQWDTPVFAHPMEHPYLDGSTSYPQPDPSVGGGLMAALSSMYPRGPVNIKARLQSLPEEGEVPFMPGWRWIHTPGHSPGHVSLWRESDRTLLAGDAFITTNQESAYAVAIQLPEIHGPPMYYTTDWKSARESVCALAALEPELVVSGHGSAIRGSEMRGALQVLANDFDRVAVPEQGIYVRPEAASPP